MFMPNRFILVIDKILILTILEQASFSSLDLRPLASGVYFLKMKYISGDVTTSKLIVK